MTVITAENLHRVQVVLSPAVNTRDAPLPKRLAFHIVPPYYFDPALLNAQDWEVLRSDSTIAHPEVALRAGKEFRILGEVATCSLAELDAQQPKQKEPKKDASKTKIKGKEEVQEDSWGSYRPTSKGSTEKPTEPSTIGSPEKAQQQSLKLHVMADSTQQSLALNVGADSSHPPMLEENDLRKTLTARRSKSPLIVLAENTQGPANLIRLPPKDKLDTICPDEIYQLVGECK